jgi:hypothetical protein
MKDIIRVIYAEINRKIKDIIGIIGLLVVLWFLNFFLEYAFATTFIMSFTAFSIIFETQYFKEKNNRFSNLPLTRIKIFIVESFRMSVFVIFVNIFYMILLGFYSFPNNEYITYNNVITYTVGYFAASQFIIMLRHIQNTQFLIYEKIGVGILYSAYLLALVLLTHYIIDNYIDNLNYLSSVAINFTTLFIFISLLLPANYLIFKNRGDYLK